MVNHWLYVSDARLSACEWISATTVGNFFISLITLSTTCLASGSINEELVEKNSFTSTYNGSFGIISSSCFCVTSKTALTLISLTSVFTSVITVSLCSTTSSTLGSTAWQWKISQCP